MKAVKILWADDEIDLLKPHILFLEEKGYSVCPVISGQDAVSKCREEAFDLIFLDENMPGLGGLDTLLEIKKIHPSVPIVMITKSEEEDLMEQAIGKQIADYLIKPINSKQILMAVKKLVHAQEIISEKTTLDYQRQFMELSDQIRMAQTPNDWSALSIRPSGKACDARRGALGTVGSSITSQITLPGIARIVSTCFFKSRGCSILTYGRR